MKKFIILFFLVTSLSCCDKDDDKPIAEIDKLPPPTQIGANTAGCLVNGESFLPNNQSVQPLVCNYLDGQNFSLGISNKKNGIYYKVYIYIGNTNLQVGQTYQLSNEIDSKFGEYYIQYPLPNFYELHYKTKSSVIGELKITHHDFDNATISGTFWYDAKFDYAYNFDGNVNQEEIFQIREGRFDMEY